MTAKKYFNVLIFDYHVRILNVVISVSGEALFLIKVSYGYISFSDMALIFLFIIIKLKLIIRDNLLFSWWTPISKGTTKSKKNKCLIWFQIMKSSANKVNSCRRWSKISARKCKKTLQTWSITQSNSKKKSFPKLGI